jgi:hypothetical protein
MNPRIWRTSTLAGSIALVVLLTTQGAAGQPPAGASGASLLPEGVLMSADSLSSRAGSRLTALPESASLLLLGTAFALAARQLRRII